MKEAKAFKAAKAALDAHDKERKLNAARITVAEAAGDTEAVERLKEAYPIGDWAALYNAARDAAVKLVGALDIQPHELKHYL